MEALVQLQNIEFDSTSKSASAKQAVEKLRAQVPQQVLGHYDRLRARGKKGLALVRHQVCGECHMGVPIGTVVTIMKGADIQLCGNCGRYLYVLPEAPEPVPVSAEPPPTKRARQPKKKIEQQATRPS